MNEMSELQSDLSTRDFVLATDLDGTFLGGSDIDRRRLYDWIEAHRATIGLVFVTGRDPDFIVELCETQGVPWPEYVIGDVGTTIARVRREARRLDPIAALEADIARRWGDSGARVREALDAHPGLTLQPTAFRYRVSYDLDPDAFDGSAADKVAALGLDHLISDNRYFDVLPKGVSKGPSLRRLVAHLGLDEGRVLAAGDTLNDHSMLASGLRAVAVGGSEPALLERLEEADHIHRAEAIGAAGILEAVAAFGLHPTPKG
ncbi:HAD hydrolase family protein [Halovulum dunhuangense]|uniref:HAD hydrolase family protein n=1 Tax=Halovulum dunhuangense TaxID=1505036 RepID=A0A849KV14_9RHOB|nr:HAD family hydrolase [Halovulum dunhuangense]NNU79481.1 HAD hydrolase family protein [Halovulum dunhuangense]